MADMHKLGSLSEKYESGGRGPEIVSRGIAPDGKPDPGGVSYGSYQMTSQVILKNGDVVIGGRVSEFLKTEGKEWAGEFKGLTPGTPDFSAKWKEIVARDPEKLKHAEHAYIERTHFKPVVTSIEKDPGLDINQFSDTFKDVIWSTAVQHGPGNTVVSTALKGKDISKMSEEEMIKAIYSERTRRYKKDAARYTAEQEDALAMLKGLPLPSKQPVLKEGARGDSVRKLQEQLQRMGYNVGTDGVFGPKTKAAVEQFQKDHGLKADGIVGNNTLSALSKADSYASLPQIQRQAYTPKSQPSFKPLEQPRLQESLQKLRK